MNLVQPTLTPKSLSAQWLLLFALILSVGSTTAYAQDAEDLDGLFGDAPAVKEAPLPEDPDALVAELILRGRYEQATNVVVEMQKKFPKAAEWIVFEAQIALKTGQQKAIAPKLDTFLKLQPLNVDLLFYRGLVHEQLGELGKAQIKYAAAIKQNPTSLAGLRSNVQTGWIYLDRGLRQDAQDHWLKLLDFYDRQGSVTPDQLHAVGQACIGLALCPEVKKLFARPMYKYAQLMFDQAINKTRRHTPTWVSYGRSYSEKFNQTDARKVLKIALSVSRFDPEVRVALAQALLGSYELGYRRYELAKYHLNEALAVYPNMPGAIAQLAGMKISDGHYDEAEQMVRAALKQYPANIDLNAALGSIKVFRGRMKEFDEVAEALKKYRPKCARFYALVAETVGARFRYQEARDLAKYALEVDKDYHPALATYGINLTRTGDADLGYKILAKSQKLDPFHVYVWNTLKVLTKMRDEKEFKKFTSPHFDLIMPVKEISSAPFILTLLERAYEELGTKYGAKPPKVYVEFFSKIEDFSARSIGLPFIGALGVCFGNTMTILSATEKRLGAHSWGRTLWHEYTHVVTLTRTNNRVPRWLTEGLSVYEESRGNPNWVREYDRSLMSAKRGGLILPVAEFDSGFHKPKFRGQVLLSYFQGGMISEFVTETYGFHKILELLDAFRAGYTQSQAIRKTFRMSEAEFDNQFLAYMDRHYAGYPNSVLAPNNFAQMLQGVVIQSERETLRGQLRKEPWNLKVRGRLARTYALLQRDADARTLALDLQKRIRLRKTALIANQLQKPAEELAGYSKFVTAQLLELRAAEGDVLATLANLEMNRNRTTGVKDKLEQALKLGCSDAPWVHQQLAGLAIEKDDYQTALTHFQAIQRLVPPEAQVHRQMRFCYLKLGKEQEALQQLIKICLLDSKDLKSRIKAAGKLHAQQRWLELSQVLADVAYIDPFQSQANFYLAEALRHTGQHAKAVTAYKTALESKYKSPERCYLGIATCELALGNNKAAAEAAKKAIEIDDSLNEARDVLKRSQQGEK